MLISKQHNNRQAHNWLVYDISDRFLEGSIPLFKGVLYDLGCGDSSYKDFFLGHAEEYVGVDWAGSIHETKADISADLNRPLPIESDIADTVVSFSVMEHLCEPQVMLNEAFRILKPSGKIVLQVPWQWWIHEAPYDFFRYTPFGLKYMFEKAGFEAIEVEAQSGFFTMLTLKLNYFTARFVCGPRLLQLTIRVGLTPFWYVGQKLAPILDKLDKNWAAETNGYYVTAKKP